MNDLPGLGSTTGEPEAVAQHADGVWRDLLALADRLLDIPWPTHPDPHPTKVALFSAADIPIVKTAYPPLLPVPAVVKVAGIWMRFRVSDWVPAGQVFILDTEILKAPYAGRPITDLYAGRSPLDWDLAG